MSQPHSCTAWRPLALKGTCECGRRFHEHSKEVRRQAEAADKVKWEPKAVVVKNINAILATCEFILENGGKPSREQYNGIVNYLRRGTAQPNWDAYPLARDWFTGIR